LPGAFALNGGDLIINGIDIGSFYVNDATRDEEDNVETLVERINAASAQTGVTARAVAVPDTSPDLYGIALSNQDLLGNTTANGIRIEGRGVPGLNVPGENLPLFRRENVSLDQTRFTSERLGSGDLGAVPAGTLSINGVPLNEPMTFNAANSAEQNAQEVARAINTASNGSGVFASTDGYGFVQLRSQKAFEITGAPAALELPAQVYQQVQDTAASTGAINIAGAYTLGAGSLIVNGMDIFHEPVTLDAAMTNPQRARAIAAAINSKAIDTGITAYADTSGQIFFGNLDQQITRVAYRGDSGDNLSQIGSNSFVPLYMSGDQAFAGHRRESTLVGGNDLDASGTASLAAGELFVNGVNIGAVNPAYSDPGDPLQSAQDFGNALITAINAQAGITGVRAELDTANTGSVRLLLKTNGQDIRIESAPGLEASLLASTGLTSGSEVRQQIDVFETVVRLRDEVRNSKYARGGAETISIQLLKEVSDAVDVLVGNRVELGVRTQRAELVDQRSQLTEEVMQQQLVANREIDLAELISRLTQEETALQAAYAITQRINSLSLLNFI